MKLYHWRMALIGVIIYILTVRFGPPVRFDILFFIVYSVVWTGLEDVFGDKVIIY